MTTNSHPAVVRIVARWCLQGYEPHEARAAGAVYGRHRRVHMKRVVFGLVVASLVAVGVVWATPRKIPYRTALAVSDSRENTGNVKSMF